MGGPPVVAMRQGIVRRQGGRITRTTETSASTETETETASELDDDTSEPSTSSSSPSSTLSSTTMTSSISTTSSTSTTTPSTIALAPSETSTSASDSSDIDGMSSTSIATIASSAVLFVLLLIGCFFLFRRLRRKRRQHPDNIVGRSAPASSTSKLKPKYQLKLGSLFSSRGSYRKIQKRERAASPGAKVVLLNNTQSAVWMKSHHKGKSVDSSVSITEYTTRPGFDVAVEREVDIEIGSGSPVHSRVTLLANEAKDVIGRDSESIELEDARASRKRSKTESDLDINDDDDDGTETLLSFNAPSLPDTVSDQRTISSITRRPPVKRYYRAVSEGFSPTNILPVNSEKGPRLGPNLQDGQDTTTTTNAIISRRSSPGIQDSRVPTPVTDADYSDLISAERSRSLGPSRSTTPQPSNGTTAYSNIHLNSRENRSTASLTDTYPYPNLNQDATLPPELLAKTPIHETSGATEPVQSSTVSDVFPDILVAGLRSPPHNPVDPMSLDRISRNVSGGGPLLNLGKSEAGNGGSREMGVEGRKESIDGRHELSSVRSPA